MSQYKFNPYKEKSMLYEVAIVEEPTPKEKEDGGMERIILAPTAVIASDSQSSIAIAATKIGTETKFDSNRIRVYSRPFV